MIFQYSCNCSMFMIHFSIFIIHCICKEVLNTEKNYEY